MNFSRRRLMSTAALAVPAALLAGCAISTVNEVTTITLNTATVDTYAKAMDVAGAALLANPIVSAAMGPAAVAIAQTALAGITAGASAFDTATAGKATVTFNSTSVPNGLLSVYDDANTLLSEVNAAVAAQTGTLASDVSQYVSSLQTIFGLFGALLTAVLPAAAVGAKKLPMTEAQALAVVHLTAPK